MSYSELVQAYFERSVALQWYWTIFVLVIGGIGAFATIRQRPELVTTVLVTILFAGFAYKNWGAIAATAEEREAVRLTIKGYPDAGWPHHTGVGDVRRVRDRLEAKMPEYDVAGAGYFHVACDLLLIAFVWAKEWRRRRPERTPVAGAT